MTIKEAVIKTKCRKGPATGITKRGAFWLCRTVKIKRCGGDGIGNSAPNVDHWLELRYFRSGEVRSVIRVESWHQNHGSHVNFYDASSVLDCSTVEDVIAALKGVSLDGDSAYGDFYEEELTAMLILTLEIPRALPSPDDN